MARTLENQGAQYASRRVRIEGDLAFIPLTQGLEAVIDVADIGLVDGRNWHAHNKGRIIYARSQSLKGRVEGSKSHKVDRLHRIIAAPPDGFVVDHINGNGLDNRRCNLRIATISENSRNRRINLRHSTGFKGVKARYDCTRWEASIGYGGKRYHIGLFKSPEEAHAAYVAKSKEVFGDFHNPETMSVVAIINAEAAKIMKGYRK